MKAEDLENWAMDVLKYWESLVIIWSHTCVPIHPIMMEYWHSVIRILDAGEHNHHKKFKKKTMIRINMSYHQDQDSGKKVYHHLFEPQYRTLTSCAAARRFLQKHNLFLTDCWVSAHHLFVNILKNLIIYNI